MHKQEQQDNENNPQNSRLRDVKVAWSWQGKKEEKKILSNKKYTYM